MYKEEKFIPVPIPADWHTGYQYACVTRDAWYFVDHEEEIQTYMKKTFGYYKMSGMLLFFKTEQDRFMFLLRWS